MLACFIIFTEMLVCLHLCYQLSYVYYGKQASIDSSLDATFYNHWFSNIATAVAKISRIDDGYVFVVHSIIVTINHLSHTS